MKKIHIGSKINLVEVPDGYKYQTEKDYLKELNNAIDNPIAEFDDKEKLYSCLFPDEMVTVNHGIYDIPEGYRVEVKPKYIGSMYCSSEHKRIASLVTIKEDKCNIKRVSFKAKNEKHTQ